MSWWSWMMNLPTTPWPYAVNAGPRCFHASSTVMGRRSNTRSIDARAIGFCRSMPMSALRRSWLKKSKHYYRPERFAPTGYFISRKMYFLGKRLRFGGVGTDWVLRLFRREKGRYRPLEIHEQVAVNGSTLRLQGSLDHFSYATLEEYLEKIPAYTAHGRAPDAGRRANAFRHSTI